MALKVLHDRILQEGRCLEGGILKVDRFVNHQMDPYLMKQIAIEFIRRFADVKVNISRLTTTCFSSMTSWPLAMPARASSTSVDRLAPRSKAWASSSRKAFRKVVKCCNRKG